jgi:hypothetical protein
MSRHFINLPLAPTTSGITTGVLHILPMGKAGHHFVALTNQSCSYNYVFPSKAIILLPQIKGESWTGKVV